MDNGEKELERLGIRATPWNSHSVDPNGVASQAAGTQQPSTGRVMSFAAVTVIFLLALCMIAYVPDIGGDASLNVLRGSVMLVAAIMVWGRRLVPVIIGLVISGLFILAAIPSLFGSDSANGLIALVSLAGAFGVSWFGSPLFKREKYVLTLNQRVYGVQPTEWGRGSDDSNRSSIWIMGLLLNKLTRIPGVFVFHGLKSPGSLFIDVEHVVTHKNNVYLIDSWHSYPSEHNWHLNKRGTVISSKGDDGHRHTKMANAADRYRKILGQDVNIIPIIAIVTGKPIIGPDRWSPRGVGLFNADELLDYIGTEASHSLPTWHDRPDVREKIVTTVV